MPVPTAASVHLETGDRHPYSANKTTKFPHFLALEYCWFDPSRVRVMKGAAELPRIPADLIVVSYRRAYWPVAGEYNRTSRLRICHIQIRAE